MAALSLSRSPYFSVEKATVTDVEQKTISSATLKEVALLFLKLGTTAFGGPAAHIAMMED